jgi:glycosyltransferase involved in cell wall biosynthesis
MTVIFWQNCTSIHQYPLLSELTAMGVEVIQVVEELVPEDRSAMGWNVPDGGYKVFLFGAVNVHQVIDMHPDAFHVFSGFNAFRMVSKIFREIYSICPERCFVFQERPDLRGFKGLLRRLAYRWYCYRFRKIGGILAAGSIAFFRSMTRYVPIVPFPYYVYPPKPGENTEPGNGGPVRFVFVGALIPRKNISGMCEAFARTKGHWDLTIIGDGSEARHVDALKLARPDCTVTRLGFLNNADIGLILHRSDCLVLPSLMDGYGVVVNEGALCGLRILCSIAAGSSEHLKDLGVKNWLVDPTRIRDITECIDQISDLGHVGAPEREGRMNAAMEMRPEEGARRLLRTLDAR